MAFTMGFFIVFIMVSVRVAVFLGPCAVVGVAVSGFFTIFFCSFMMRSLRPKYCTAH